MVAVTITNRDITALGLWGRDRVHRVARGLGGVVTLDPDMQSQQVIELLSAIGTIDVAVTPPPENTREPEISGTAAVGQTLTLDPGDWEGEDTLAFQWELDGIAVEDETDLTFVVPSDSEGEWVTAVVTATGLGGVTSVETDQYGPVAE